MIELKDFSESDFKIFKSWIKNEEELVQFAGSIFTFPLTNKQLTDYIKMSDKKPMKIVLTETDETIGHCELNFENGNNRLSRILIGSKKMRGKKIGEKVVLEMTKLLFEDTKVKKIDLNVFDWNVGAIKCYENVGFKINNKNSKIRKVNGKIWKSLNMELTKRQFEEKNASKNFKTIVREIESNDIDLIANYWLNSDPDFLTNMGVDLNKMPTRDKLINMLTEQINSPLNQKNSYALIWEVDGVPIGHSNVNGIDFGNLATMHLHIWKPDFRKKGLGAELVKKSLPFYFEKLKLNSLYCEPFAFNPAPNKTLEKVGFEFVKKYRTIPGSLNFEQEVNRWKLTKKNYIRIVSI